MMGTSFSVTEAMRVTPPRKMKAATRARITPTIQVGTFRASRKALLMALDWTMLPVKPRAKMMARAKKPARILPKVPLKACRM